MRYAVKIGYDGSLFHGSQRQGDDDPGSVEGAVNRALKTMGEIDHPRESTVKFSSRTDSGVSALGNVFAIDTDRDPGVLLKALNANTDGIWCWASGEMREQQNPRWATNRWYRYHLPPKGYDVSTISRINEAVLSFMGTHDFRYMSRQDDERNTEMTIERAQAYDVSGGGDMVIIDVVGTRFLWNQIRRMVGAATAYSTGDVTLEDIRSLIDGKTEESAARNIAERITTAPPHGLILMDVHFKDVDFQIDESALEMAIRAAEETAWRSTVKVLLHSALRSLMTGTIPIDRIDGGS
ncbi:MAG: tRNA pseudouridine synthase A [Thermoplasmatota archaeon]